MNQRQPDTMLATCTVIIAVTLAGLDLCSGQTSQPTVNGLTEIQRKITTSQYECYMKMMTDPPYEGEGAHCNRTWDGWGCWGDTQAGQEAELNCPDYFRDFDTSLRATKRCMDDGSWYRHPDSNRSWSNYTICNANTRANKQRHLNLLYITQAGNWLSLLALVVSLGIFFYFKSLSCPRITIHKNLFFAFIFNSILWIIWFMVVVPDQKLLDQNPVSCRVLHVLTQYAMGCNYFWMLCEGIYLHTLIVVAVFSEKGSLLWYYLLGWGFPAIPTIIYTVVRSIYADDKKCWINANTKLLYVIQGPIIAALLVNLFFLLNILRVLITKLRATNTPETNSYRKAVRATLILVPLLGIQFVVVPFRPPDGTTAEVIYDYASTILMNYQGLFVALIYCFFNGEVIGQVKRKWRNFQAERNRGGRYSQHRGSHSFFATASTTMTTSTELVPFNPARKSDANGSHLPTMKMPMIPEKDSLEERMEENSV